MRVGGKPCSAAAAATMGWDDPTPTRPYLSRSFRFKFQSSGQSHAAKLRNPPALPVPISTSQTYPSSTFTPLSLNPSLEFLPDHDEMAKPIETLTQQLIHRATDPFSLAILTGVTSSSFFFFGTSGLALHGVVPAIITESERTKKGISDTSALKMWEWAFLRARVRF